MDCRSSYGDPPYLRTLAASPAWAPAAVELCERGALRAARFGPFTSTPERGWRSLISGELRGLLRAGDRIVASASQPVAADGAPIGFPPLHNHHVHVRKGERGVDRLKEWVGRGGVLVAMSGGMRFAARDDVGLLPTDLERLADGKPEGDHEGDVVDGTQLEDQDAYQSAILPEAPRPDSIPGVLLRTKATTDTLSLIHI